MSGSLLDLGTVVSQPLSQVTVANTVLTGLEGVACSESMLQGGTKSLDDFSVLGVGEASILGQLVVGKRGLDWLRRLGDFLGFLSHDAPPSSGEGRPRLRNGAIAKSQDRPLQVLGSVGQQCLGRALRHQLALCRRIGDRLRVYR